MISSSFETHRNARIHTREHKYACSHVSTRARVCPIASSKQKNSIYHAQNGELLVESTLKII